MKLQFECMSAKDAVWIHDTDECMEVIKAMKRQEMKYSCCDYLNQADPTSASVAINEECRSRMCEWCYQTVDYFSLSRSSVHIAMSCLDRFLTTPRGKKYISNRSLYQLACIACLYVTIKVHEPVELGLSVLVELCRGAYSTKQILEAEQSILSALDWAINPPSPKAFIHQYITFLPKTISQETRNQILDLACYQADLALSDYKLGVLFSPSKVAFASILNAIAYIPSSSQFLSTDLDEIDLSLEMLDYCEEESEQIQYALNVMSIQLNDTKLPANFYRQFERQSKRIKSSNPGLQKCTFPPRSMSPVAVFNR